MVVAPMGVVMLMVTRSLEILRTTTAVEKAVAVAVVGAAEAFHLDTGAQSRAWSSA